MSAEPYQRFYDQSCFFDKCGCNRALEHSHHYSGDCESSSVPGGEASGLRLGKVQLFDRRGMPRLLRLAIGDGFGTIFVLPSFVVHECAAVGR